ncbi:hypothetical protein RJ55_06873 [Drechmeria coniospora]|nr:hypothetical protein RJ55_06873 [Drechmeria coniospora]
MSRSSHWPTFSLDFVHQSLCCLACLPRPNGRDEPSSTSAIAFFLFDPGSSALVALLGRCFSGWVHAHHDDFRSCLSSDPPSPVVSHSIHSVDACERPPKLITNREANNGSALQTSTWFSAYLCVLSGTTTILALSRFSVARPVRNTMSCLTPHTFTAAMTPLPSS